MPNHRKDSRGKHTENLRPPWRKGQSGNPRGRPPAPWRTWLAAQEPSFREALAALARNARVKPETRARIFMFFVDHAHGHPKQPVESEWPANVRIIVRPSDVGPGRKE